MSLERISSKPSSSLQNTQPSTLQPKIRLHPHELSSLESLNIHQKEPSTLFECIQRFFELLCLPFRWLYNLLFPSSASKKVEEAIAVPKSLEQATTPENPTLAETFEQPVISMTTTTPEEPTPVAISQETTPEQPIASTTRVTTLAEVDTAMFPVCIAEQIFVPSNYPEHIKHPNKRAAYNFLMDNNEKYKDTPISFYKYALAPENRPKDSPLFRISEGFGYYCEPGPMPYGSSTEEEIRWFANFADPRVMGFCEGPLFAQDEIQVLEHPVLYHVKSGLLETNNQYMRKNQVYLLKNVPSMGRIDSFTPVAFGKPPLYGNGFVFASPAEVLKKIQRQNGTSNIFFIAAPSIRGNLAGKPYQYEHLAQLFYTAYTAFYGIRIQSNNAKCHVHTGNWGAGAFGNSAKVSHLMQLAAGRAADVILHFHPLTQREDFFAAQDLFKDIEQQHPNISIHEFLEHLVQNADKYQLFYGKSNGT